MKNKYLGIFVICVSISFSSLAKQYTSVTNGNWNAPATWGSVTAPAATDTATIKTGTTVTISATATINKVTVNSGGTLTVSRNFTVNKILINNGTVTGTRRIRLSGTGIVISGNGSYTGHSGAIQFYNTTQTIDVGVVIQKATGNVTLMNNTFPGITVTNNGQVLLTGGNTLATNVNTKASTFTMGVNSVLSVSAAPLNNALAVLNASANGCAVNYFGGAYNIKIPSAGQYYDMSVQAGTKTNSSNLIMHSLTVAGGTFANAGFNLNLTGNWTNNGTISGNTGTVTFNGAAAQTITDAGGSAAFATLIMAGSNTLNFASNVTASTSFTISSGTVDVTGANSSLGDQGNFTNNGTFTARQGTVTMNGGGAQTLGGTTSTSFYNLTLNGATVTLGNNETIANTLLISAGTLDASVTNYNLTVGQNFTNNSTFTSRNGTVTMSGNTSTPLNIGGTSTTTFYNLTSNPTNAGDVVLLGKTATINNNFTVSKGTFNSQNFQITGNGSGLLTMAANTSLLLGLTTVATNVAFPTNYTTANIALNATSTVTYQANIAQTVSVTPHYGNLTITNGNAAVTKIPSGATLTIAGNLNVTKGAGVLTYSETTNTINLTGNYTATGIVTYTTGKLNIGGNFTNNGTFTAGTSTVTFNGTAAQSLGGTTATTFNLLTINNSTNSTITLGNNTTVSSILTITKGTLDVSATNYALNVAGNFLNSSGFNARAGTVTLNGAAAQSIGGTATTSFYSLTLSGTTITLNHNASFQNVLTVNSGALNGPDSMTAISNALRTARIAPVAAGASIGANFIMQRYITGTIANYQALSSPAKASILKDWDYDAGFYMSGTTGNDGNARQGNGSIYYSVYTFNEPKNKYDSVNTDNQPLTPGLGLYLWMGNSLTSFAPFTFDTKGIPNAGNVNYNVTKTSHGTNLIGNPYQSPLQWTTFQTANSGKISGTFYVFDETAGNWESSNGIVGSGGRLVANPNIIPAHQGFMVTATAAGVITFKEAHKSVTDAPLVREADPTDMFRVALTTNANTFSCHSLIMFNDSASDLYSTNEDALFVKSHLTNVPVVYSVSKEGEQLINNTLPGITQTKDVTLYAGGGDAGMYTLTFNNISSLTKYNCVVLEDVKNGKWMQVTEGSSYQFILQESGQSYKFILHFTALQPNQECTVPESSTEQNSTAGIDILSSQVGAQVRFTLPQAQDVTISVYNMLGEKAEADIYTSASENTVEVPLPATSAIYIVRVQTPYGVVNQRIYH